MAAAQRMQALSVAPVQQWRVEWEVRPLAGRLRWHRWEGRMHGQALADEHYAFEGAVLTWEREDGGPLVRGRGLADVLARLLACEARQFVHPGVSAFGAIVAPDGRWIVDRGVLLRTP